MTDDALYLIHIRDCLRRIQEYTAAGHANFMGSTLHQDAVIRNFEIIGEAAKRISPSTKATYGGIPWRRISGFRDVLIHDYMGVDLAEVWNIVEQDVPVLARDIAAILDEMGITE